MSEWDRILTSVYLSLRVLLVLTSRLNFELCQILTRVFRDDVSEHPNLFAQLFARGWAKSDLEKKWQATPACFVKALNRLLIPF